MKYDTIALITNTPVSMYQISTLITQVWNDRIINDKAGPPKDSKIDVKLQ